MGSQASEFFEKYKDVRWQKKRLEVLEFNGWACECCGEDNEQLHVHHKRYLKGRNPWDYDVEQLSAVCGDCHRGLGEQNDLLNKVLSLVPVHDPIGAPDLPYLIAGMYGLEIGKENIGKEILYELGSKIVGNYFELLAEDKKKQEAE